MKKLLKALAVALCLAMCVGVLAACGGEEVTEADWNKAVSFEGLTNYVLSGEITSDGEKQTVKLEREGDKIKTTSEGKEIYYQKDGTSYYKYSKNASDAWTKTDSSQMEFEAIFGSSIGIVKSVKFTELKFENGQYSTPDQEGSALKVTIKGKKVAEIEMTMKIGNKSITSKISLTYNNAKVTLPTVA